jgi:hypothetical protein
MPWWAYLYIAYLAYVGVASVQSSAKEHGAGATVLELMTSIAWPVLVASYFAPAFGRMLGWSVVLLFTVAAPWTAYTIWRDVRRLPTEPWVTEEEHPRGMYWAAIAYCVVLVVPVAILGVIVVDRALRAS